MTKARVGFLLFICTSALSQVFPFEAYTTADSLPSNWITSLHQDSRGYLWIRTSEGLAVYDGVKYKSYFIAEDEYWLIFMNTAKAPSSKPISPRANTTCSKRLRKA